MDEIQQVQEQYEAACARTHEISVATEDARPMGPTNLTLDDYNAALTEQMRLGALLAKLRRQHLSDTMARACLLLGAAEVKSDADIAQMDAILTERLHALAQFPLSDRRQNDAFRALVTCLGDGVEVVTEDVPEAARTECLMEWLTSAQSFVEAWKAGRPRTDLPPSPGEPEAALGVQEAARLDRDLSTAIRESAHQQDQIVQERERVKQLEGELAREVDRGRRANRETAAAHQMFHDSVAIIRANIGHPLAPGWVLSDAVADLVSQRDVERAVVASQKGALEALTDRASRLIAGLKAIAEARTQCSCDSGLAWDMGGTAHVVLSAEGVVQDGDTGHWSKPTDDQPGRYDALVVIGMSLLDTLAHDCTPTRGQRTKLRQALESATAGTPGPLNVRIAELEAEVRDLSGKLNRECERADFWKRDAVARGATA